jgi:hypothetical protein
MDLMPDEVRAILPPLYSQEKKGNTAVFPVKYFLPNSAATWWIMEFDGDDLMFGYCDLGMGFPELGYVSLRELQELRSRPVVLHDVRTNRTYESKEGLPVERDLWYTPKTLDQIKASMLGEEQPPPSVLIGETWTATDPEPEPVEQVSIDRPAAMGVEETFDEFMENLFGSKGLPYGGET